MTIGVVSALELPAAGVDTQPPNARVGIDGRMDFAVTVRPAGWNGAAYRIAVSAGSGGFAFDLYGAAPPGTLGISNVGFGVLYQPVILSAVVPYAMGGWSVSREGVLYVTQGLAMAGAQRNILGVTAIGFQPKPRKSVYLMLLVGHQDPRSVPGFLYEYWAPRLILGWSGSQPARWPWRSLRR